MEHRFRYEAIFENKFRDALAYFKRNTRAVFDRISSQMDKILYAPELGKPLRYGLKNSRRIHVGSFVLLYEIRQTQKEILFLDFDHHDKIYKRE